MIDIQGKLEEIGPYVPQDDDDMLICRCEEVTKGEIRKQYMQECLRWKRSEDFSVPEWDFVRDRLVAN